ncbi:MAG: sel1 repeat family protein, partial [Hyphomicrobiales bacterium]|nr:sel1 repeat family protein [Hyphomicrobiales bacterium]
MSRFVGTMAAVLVWASGVLAQEPIVLTPPGIDDIPAPPPAAAEPSPAAPSANIFSEPTPVVVPVPRLRPDRQTADVGRSLEPLGVIDLPTLPGTGFEALPGTPAEVGSTEDRRPAPPADDEMDLAVVEPLPSPDGPDRAYGAFQRGLYLTAFDIAIPLAEKGDTAAQTLIGLIYEGGYGVPQSLPDALSWYQIAANAGDREAQFALGMMHLEGRGVERDRVKAAEFFEQAARQGQIDAMYNLGLFHLEGTVRPLDPELAAAYLSRAAEAGNPNAQYALAQIYAQGLGLEVD